MLEFSNDSRDVMELAISLPLDGHTGSSLRNLLNLLYSRGPMLSKAMGMDIGIDKELLYILDAAPTPDSPKEFIEMVNRYAARFGGIRGVHFSEDEIALTGFDEALDEVHIKAYTELTTRFNRMALTQKRIQAKEINNENAKYAMHIFLIRLGFTGPDFKQERKILMERLEGSQAFRTQAQAEQAKIKALQNRTARHTQEA